MVRLQWVNDCGSWWSRSSAQLMYDVKLKPVHREEDDELDQ